MDIRFDSTLGATDDPTSFAVFVEDMSQVSIGSGVTVWGSVTAWSGRVRVFAATLHGQLTLERFSDGIVQSNAVVEGGIVCRSGSDALCGGAAATATDCPSSRTDCSFQESSEEPAQTPGASGDRWLPLSQVWPPRNRRFSAAPGGDYSGFQSGSRPGVHGAKIRSASRSNSVRSAVTAFRPTRTEVNSLAAMP